MQKMKQLNESKTFMKYWDAIKYQETMEDNCEGGFCSVKLHSFILQFY